jgi:sugar/nucleoside kinase (ribokinase family)
MATLFISYSHKDKPFVDILADRLRKAGHDPFIDDAFRFGDVISEEISRAIRRSDYVIAVISRNAALSRWVSAEIDLALQIEQEKNRNVIIPIRIDDTEPPGFLAGRLCGDFRSADNFESPFARLIRSLDRTIDAEEKQKKERAILIVGSALVEDFLPINPEDFVPRNPDQEESFANGYIRLDDKYDVGERQRFFGGSGVNFSVRLATTDHIILPILSVGNDEPGRRLKELLVGCAANHIKSPSAKSFIDSEGFLCDGLRTSQAVVISVRGKTRTTFTPRVIGLSAFPAFFRRRLAEIASIPDLEVSAVMIGHIHADHPEQEHGEITKMIVDSFSDRGLIFANFGRTQLNYGVKFWQQTLKKISLVQFSLPEIRRFFANDFPHYSLCDIVKWLMDEEITSVITYRKIDIIAIFQRGAMRGRILFASPFDAGRALDTTGAGDAFAAGMIAKLKDKVSIDFDSFASALDEGRIWAAFACTTIGSSNRSPTTDMLANFAKRGTLRPIDVKDFLEAQKYLQFIDNLTS